jgi:WD40 repeat protein
MRQCHWSRAKMYGRHSGLFGSSLGLGIFKSCAAPHARRRKDIRSVTIRLWDVKTGTETARLEGYTFFAVNALCVLPEGRLASGSRGMILLWDIAARREIARLEIDNGIGCLAALPDGRLVAGDANGRLHWLEIIT